MVEEPTPSEYRANDADALVGELFSGKLSMHEALHRLRKRLLDLSTRNRLLNYRHPKRRCLQFAGEPNINLLFARLFIDARSFLIKPVPEPGPLLYEGRRTDAKQHAESLGFKTSYEFQPSPLDTQSRCRLTGLQTLYYPAELERLLRKIASEAKSAIEETGTNMLFLIFGFLEFYDSDDSDLPLLAPLISLPVALTKAGIDKDTGVYQYTLSYNGEDLAENHTLREKLKQDFSLNLPEFGEDDELETYYGKIEGLVRTKKRWRVRRQLTLGMLSFGKLAIWADLDPQKSQAILQHPLLKMVFEGGQADAGGGFFAEDYKIDESAEAISPIIYDADSSQHSAIIDALSGKNMVINGPPGTGKSQTITNVIAAAIAQGKKVLFVSEKLAALEVVRHRLDQAGLGHFCLELHSHKTQKKKLLKDIQARLEQEFSPPAHLQPKIASLQRHKKILARYAELMGSRIGNNLGLTVNEVFWAAERRRQELGELSNTLYGLALPGSRNWTLDEIEARKSTMESFSELYEAVGCFDSSHPWWGFKPTPLSPSDDEAIVSIIRETLPLANRLDTLAEELRSFLEDKNQIDFRTLGEIHSKLRKIPSFPEKFEAGLLPKLFAPDDPKGRRSDGFLKVFSGQISRFRQLFAQARSVLDVGKEIPFEETERVKIKAEEKLSQSFLKLDLAEAGRLLEAFEKAIASFERVAASVKAPYSLITKATCQGIAQRLDKAAWIGFEALPLQEVHDCVDAVESEVKALSSALNRVEAVAKNRDLIFDASPEDIIQLFAPSGFKELNREALFNEADIEKGRQLIDFDLSHIPLQDMETMQRRLQGAVNSLTVVFERTRENAHGLGFDFDETPKAVNELAALARVARAAPFDLLKFRGPAFGQAGINGLIERAEKEIAQEASLRQGVEPHFYLDSLPPINALKAGVRTFRRGDRFGNCLSSEWRHAKKLFDGLAKEKRKRKAREREELFTHLIAWLEHREDITDNATYKDSFGDLFRGIETDMAQVRRLHDWYQTSLSCLIQCPGLIDRIDLTALEVNKLLQLSAKADEIITDAELLVKGDSQIKEIIGIDVPGAREAKAHGYPQWLALLQKKSDKLMEIVQFFLCYAKPTVSSKRALQLMEAKLELIEASADLAHLMRGQDAIEKAGGEALGALGSLEVKNWREHLTRVAEICGHVRALGDYCKNYVDSSTPVSLAKT